MQYIFLSFLAGILTAFAPCVFTLLPVILGGSIKSNRIRKPLIIIISLCISLILFTLLLKASTLLIDIPLSFWNFLSGGIVILFGIITIFPSFWESIAFKLKLQNKSDNILFKASKEENIIGEIMIGAALGPVFSSCSPTYSLILATILPLNFFTGVINLIAYSLGLALILLIIGILGQKIIKRLKWAVNPRGIFKRVLGTIFVFTGIFIITGFDKTVETYLLDKGILDITKVEINLLKSSNTDKIIKSKDDISSSSAGIINKPELNVNPAYTALEFKDIQDWINTKPLHLSDLKGKVVLIDFWTYSCINCIRTLPYIKQWYSKYKDQGFIVVGVHTPEFAFEKIKSNVEQFTRDHDIQYPIAMDNAYGTWNAYNNQYWPAEYFIDKDGKIVHTHFGEGEYDKNEKVIQYLLGLNKISSDLNVKIPINPKQSPETYLGYEKGQNFANIAEFKADQAVIYAYQESLLLNYWSLSGEWKLYSEYAQSIKDSKLKYKFSAKEVYLVMGSDLESKVLVKINGKIVDKSNKGEDVDSNGYLNVKESRLYRVVNQSQFSENLELELLFENGTKINAFTFGG